MLVRASRLIAGLGFLGIFGFAGYWSVRLGWADFLSRGESSGEVTRALRLVPEDAECHLRMAALLRREGADPRPELAQAAALNPDDFRIWTQLAGESEARADYTAAERYLLRAAAASRQFEPRWRLVNFYFRREDPKRFWHWARDALAMSYDDPTPVFRLCRQMTASRAAESGAIERILPDQRRLLSAYLRFLVAENNLAASRRVALRLLPEARDTDLPDLLFYCDRLLAELRGDSAVEIWNGLCRRGLVPYAPLVPEQGRVVTNGKFARDPLGSAFDWRFAPLPGVTMVRMGKGGGLRITFSGRQPESCEPLAQWIPGGGPGRRLRVEYRTFGIPAASGLRWTVLDAASGKEGAAVPLSADAWSHAEARFSPRLARLVLSYRRMPGTTRIEGSVELRRVEVVVDP
jgi:hypothetical protein